MSKYKREKNLKRKRWGITVIVGTIHLALIYIAYSISSRYVYDNKIAFVSERMNGPTGEGNLIIFWSIFAASVLGVVLTGIVWYLANKKSNELVIRSVRSFLFANIILAVAIITAAFLTFDQLVGIIIYLLFLILLIYFRDY